MQYMRPGQLQAAGRKFPVVYVPFGLIEMHGRHLPMGCDAIKAHGVLIKCAQRFGGVVYPQLFFHNGFVEFGLVGVLQYLFERLKQTGFRVIIGVSGHGVQPQLDMIEEALKPVLADGTIAGMALHETSLCECEEAGGDHAAKWETSAMMFFYPDTVDMAELGDEPLTPEHYTNPGSEKVAGIGGLDPRKHASAAVGQRAAELEVESIAAKARELLESLPEDQRSFNLPAVTPEHWYYV